MFKLFPNRQVCIFKTNVKAELTVLSLPSVSPSVLLHLPLTSWKFFNVLAYGCYPSKFAGLMQAFPIITL